MKTTIQPRRIFSNEKWLLLLTVFLRCTATFSFGMVLQLRLREIGASIFVVNLLATVDGGIRTISTPVWGSISDRMKNRGQLLILLSLIPGVMYFGYAFISIPLILVIYKGAVSFFESGFIPISISLSCDYSSGSKNDMAKKMSFVNTAASSGMLFGRFIIAFFLIYLSLKATTLTLGIIALISVIPSLGLKKTRKSYIVGVKKSFIQRLFPAISDPAPMKKNGLWSIYFAAFMRQFAVSGAWASIAVYLTEDIGLASGIAILISSLDPFFQAVSHAMSSKFIGNIGSKKCNLHGIVQSTIALGLLAYGKSWIVVTTAHIIIGVAYGFFLNGSLSFITDNSPENRRAEFLGIFDSFRFLGGMLGPLLAGAIAQYSYSWMFTITAIITLISGIFVLIFARENKNDYSTA